MKNIEDLKLIEKSLKRLCIFSPNEELREIQAENLK